MIKETVCHQCSVILIYSCLFNFAKKKKKQIFNIVDLYLLSRENDYLYIYYIFCKNRMFKKIINTNFSEIQSPI